MGLDVAITAAMGIWAASRTPRRVTQEKGDRRTSRSEGLGRNGHVQASYNGVRLDSCCVRLARAGSGLSARTEVARLSWEAELGEA